MTFCQSGSRRRLTHAPRRSHSTPHVGQESRIAPPERCLISIGVPSYGHWVSVTYVLSTAARREVSGACGNQSAVINRARARTEGQVSVGTEAVEF